MRLPGAQLFRTAPDEERRLGEVDLPNVVWVGFHVFALALLTLTALIGVVQPGNNIWVMLGLLAAAALPWVLDLMGRTMAVAVFLPLALTPIAGLGIAGWLQVVNLELGWDLVMFVVFMVVVAQVAGAPRTVAVTASLAAVGMVLLFTSYGWVHEEDVPGDGLYSTAIWMSGLGLTLGGSIAFRRAANALVEAREAREALARQEALNERRRAAQDVHDVVAHSLAVTMLHITAARMAVRRGASAEAEEALEEAESHGRASLDDIRRIVRLMRADEDASVDGIQPDLRDVEELVAGYQAAGLTVALTVVLDPAPRHPSAELAVFRVLQEGLANAARHGSGSAEVQLMTRTGGIELHIANPVPSDLPPGRRVRPRGSGLVGMRERVAAADGSFEAGMVDGRWVVTAQVPTPSCDSRSAQANGPTAPTDATMACFGQGWGWRPSWHEPSRAPGETAREPPT